MTVIEDFFDKYRIAVAPYEFNKFLKLKGYSEIKSFGKDFYSNSWLNIVFALYNRSKRINSFLQRRAGSPSKRRKQFEIPTYLDNTLFFYPKGYEYYLWARFIRAAFMRNVADRWVEKYDVAPRAAGVLVIKALYDYYKEGLKIQELMEILGYSGKSYRGASSIRAKFFEPFVKPLIPKLVWGRPELDLNYRYSLSDISFAACTLAFSSEFGLGYKELLDRKIIQ